MPAEPCTCSVVLKASMGVMMMRKAAADHDENSVFTNSGIHGAIAEVEDKVIWLEVAPEVELKISKGAVAEIITDDDDDENDDESADDLAADDADA